MRYIKSFCKLLLLQEVPNNFQNQKNQCQDANKTYRTFESILKRFWSDFTPIWDPTSFKSTTKPTRKLQATQIEKTNKDIDPGV